MVGLVVKLTLTLLHRGWGVLHYTKVGGDFGLDSKGVQYLEK